MLEAYIQKKCLLNNQYVDIPAHNVESSKAMK